MASNHIKGLTPGLVPNKLYLEKRRIDNLTTLAKLQPDDVKLLNRADGVIANQPKDGFLQVPELKDPNFNALLLPQEQTHVPGAWDALSWDGKAAPDATAIPALSTLVKTTNTTPVPLNRDEPISIASLPPQYQELAQRIQLKMNNDNNATTISPNESRQFIGTTLVQGLLPEENAQLPNLMQAVFAAQNALHPYQPGDTVDVPRLGREAIQLNDPASQGKANLVSDTTLDETQGLGTQTLTLNRKWSVEAIVPAGAEGLLLNPTTGQEIKLAAGSNPVAIIPGDWALEIWQNGARIDESEFHVPNQINEAVDLTSHAAGNLTSAGAALKRTFVSAIPPAGAASQGVFAFTTGAATQPPANVDTSKLGPPKTPIPAGLYQKTLGAGPSAFPLQLDVRPDGTQALTVNGTTGLLTAQNLQGNYAGTVQIGDAGYYGETFSAQLNLQNLYINHVKQGANFGQSNGVIQPSDRFA